ncbi:hypothetical protein OC844_007910, partial [Tilletia horrida]
MEADTAAATTRAHSETSVPSVNEKESTSPAQEKAFSPSNTATANDVEKTAVDGDAAPAEEYPTGLRFALICVSLALVIFLAALDQTIVSTAVPVVTNKFNSFQDVGWYASAYLLTSTVFQPFFGRLYADFSVKWVFLASFIIFEVGSLICALADSSPMFIVGRAIAGLGLAGGYSGSLIIATIIAPLNVRPLITSAMGAVYGVGGTVGPLIGGAFTSKVSWRWCFWINLCFLPPVAFFLIFFLTLPPRKRTTTWVQRLVAIDWLGTALALCSLICILLVFQWGGITYAWSDSRIIGLIVGFVVIGAAFWVDQVIMG